MNVIALLAAAFLAAVGAGVAYSADQPALYLLLGALAVSCFLLAFADE